MIVSVSPKNRTEGTWAVVAAEGESKGRHLADVDGMLLTDVTFTEDGSILGKPLAVWGAVIDEQLFDANMARDLGVNRPFDVWNLPTVDTDNGAFFQRGKPLKSAKRCRVFHRGVFAQ